MNRKEIDRVLVNEIKNSKRIGPTEVDPSLAWNV